MSELRILGPEDVHRLINAEEALAIAESVFRDTGLGHNRLSSPSAMSLATPDEPALRFKVKGAALGQAGVSGFRLLTAPPAAPEGLQACDYDALYDNATGRLIGLVHEEWLSGLRTAATGVVACRLLALEGPHVVALFGAGRIATEVVGLLSTAFEVLELRVKSRRPESALAFVERHGADVPFPIRAAQSNDESIEGADVVITLSEATKPIVGPGRLAPGAVLCSMGSHNEVDFAVLSEVDRFVIDDLDFVFEMGDVAAWVRQGLIDRAAVETRVDATIGEIACGAKAGRTSEADRVLAVIQGMATADIAFAAHVLEKASAAGYGLTVDLP